MLPCVIGPLCPPAALEQLIALAGPKSVFSSIFPLGCLVNEQLGNNNPRASLHPFYTSNRLFFFFFFSSKQSSCSAGGFQSTGAFREGIWQQGGEARVPPRCQ